MSVADIFSGLMESTPIGFDTGIDNFQNEVARQSYISAHMMQGHAKKELQQTGPKIKDRIYLKRGARLEKYVPGVAKDTENFQIGTNIETHWSTMRVRMGWTDQELEFNGNVDTMKRSAVKSMLKDVKAQKEMDAWVGATEDFEDLIFAQPNAGEMETVGNADVAASVLSIPAIVNEETDGLWAGFTDVEATANFTTVMGLVPSDYGENWTPQQAQYDNDNADFADPTNPNNLLAVLDLMYRRCTFRPPQVIAPEMYQKATPLGNRMVVTGETGYSRATQAMRVNGEMFLTRNSKDPSFGTIEVGGVPMIEYKTLDSLKLYKGASSVTATIANATNSGARYYFIDGSTLFPKFFTSRFFKKGKVRMVDGADDAYYQSIFVWANMFCRSRKRQGIVYPGA